MAAPPIPHDLPTLPAEPGMALAPLGPRRRGDSWRQLAFALGWRRTPAAGSDDPRAASEAFVACLADVPAVDTRALCHLLMHARSLAEVWHLRPEVYRVLALHHSQAEAELRLAALGRQFDRRAGTPRSARSMPV